MAQCRKTLRRLFEATLTATSNVKRGAATQAEPPTAQRWTGCMSDNVSANTPSKSERQGPVSALVRRK
jgi:hypothetical protein